MNNSKLWIAGRVIDEGGLWEILGVYDCEILADQACHDSSCFIGPIILNRKMPVETIEWPDLYYPRLFDVYFKENPRVMSHIPIFTFRKSSIDLLRKIGINVVYKQYHKSLIFSRVKRHSYSINSILAMLVSKWDGLSKDQRIDIAQAMAGVRQSHYFISLIEIKGINGN